MKTTLISGISRGLGAELALELLDRGYHVVGFGRTNNSRLAKSDKFRFVKCDLSDDDFIVGLDPVFSELASAKQTQLILINNAATAAPAGVFGGLSPTDINQSLQLNLLAATQLANLFCQYFMALKCDKRIINISSGAAFTAIKGSGIYCIAKAGMEMLTQTIAAEIEHHGVSAMSIQPGVIDTDMQTWLRQQPSEDLPSVDMYQGFQEHEQLLSAAIVAQNIINSAILTPARNGESFNHDQ